MDNIINRDLIYGSHPIKDIYFSTTLEFNPNHPIFVDDIMPSYSMSTQLLESFPRAMEESTKIEKMVTTEKFPDSMSLDVDPEETDGYHCIIHDTEGRIMARLMIVKHDCRNKTWM